MHAVTGLNHLAIHYCDATLLIAKHRLQRITLPATVAGRLHRLHVTGPHRVGSRRSSAGGAGRNQHAHG